MILFITLSIILLSVALILFGTAAVGGTVLFVIFGDLIVFVLIIMLIVKIIKKIRKK